MQFLQVLRGLLTGGGTGPCASCDHLFQQIKEEMLGRIHEIEKENQLLVEEVASLKTSSNNYVTSDTLIDPALGGVDITTSLQSSTNKDLGVEKVLCDAELTEARPAVPSLVEDSQAVEQEIVKHSKELQNLFDKEVSRHDKTKSSLKLVQDSLKKAQEKIKKTESLVAAKTTKIDTAEMSARVWKIQANEWKSQHELRRQDVRALTIEKMEAKQAESAAVREKDGAFERKEHALLLRKKTEGERTQALRERDQQRDKLYDAEQQINELKERLQSAETAAKAAMASSIDKSFKCGKCGKACDCDETSGNDGPTSTSPPTPPSSPGAEASLLKPKHSVTVIPKGNDTSESSGSSQSSPPTSNLRFTLENYPPLVDKPTKAPASPQAIEWSPPPTRLLKSPTLGTNKVRAGTANQYMQDRKEKVKKSETSASSIFPMSSSVHSTSPSTIANGCQNPSAAAIESCANLSSSPIPKENAGVAIEDNIAVNEHAVMKQSTKRGSSGKTLVKQEEPPSVLAGAVLTGGNFFFSAMPSTSNPPKAKVSIKKQPRKAVSNVAKLLPKTTASEFGMSPNTPGTVTSLTTSSSKATLLTPMTTPASAILPLLETKPIASCTNTASLSSPLSGPAALLHSCFSGQTEDNQPASRQISSPSSGITTEQLYPSSQFSKEIRSQETVSAPFSTITTGETSYIPLSTSPISTPPQAAPVQSGSSSGLTPDSVCNLFCTYIRKDLASGGNSVPESPGSGVSPAPTAVVQDVTTVQSYTPAAPAEPETVVFVPSLVDDKALPPVSSPSRKPIYNFSQSDSSRIDTDESVASLVPCPEESENSDFNRMIVDYAEENHCPSYSNMDIESAVASNDTAIPRPLAPDTLPNQAGDALMENDVVTSPSFEDPLKDIYMEENDVLPGSSASFHTAKSPYVKADGPDDMEDVARTSHQSSSTAHESPANDAMQLDTTASIYTSCHVDPPAAARDEVMENQAPKPADSTSSFHQSTGASDAPSVAIDNNLFSGRFLTSSEGPAYTSVTGNFAGNCDPVLPLATNRLPLDGSWKAKEPVSISGLIPLDKNSKNVATTPLVNPAAGSAPLYDPLQRLSATTAQPSAGSGPLHDLVKRSSSTIAESTPLKPASAPTMPPQVAPAPKPFTLDSLCSSSVPMVIRPTTQAEVAAISEACSASMSAAANGAMTAPYIKVETEMYGNTPNSGHYAGRPARVEATGRNSTATEMSQRPKLPVKGRAAPKANGNPLVDPSAQRARAKRLEEQTKKREEEKKAKAEAEAKLKREEESEESEEE